ncbi:MAG: hypothetical protein ABIP41_00700, partial [Croceibacterium sp.]
FSCFRAPSENPVFTEVGRLLPGNGRPPEPDTAPGPFAFADRAYAEALLYRSGWTGIEFEPFDFSMIVGAGTDPVADAAAYFTRIGPAARALAEMAADERARCEQRISELALRNCFEGIVGLRAGAWIVSARKP